MLLRLRLLLCQLWPGQPILAKGRGSKVASVDVMGGLSKASGLAVFCKATRSTYKRLNLKGDAFTHEM